MESGNVITADNDAKSVENNRKTEKACECMERDR